MSLNDAVDDFCAQLRRRQIEGSNAAAKRTAEIMRHLVTSQRHTTAQALIEDVKNTGTIMQAAKPNELAVGNIVRRILHIVREEAQHESMEKKLEKRETPEIDKKRIEGLLTRALKQNLSQRTMSLNNLFDRDLFEHVDGQTEKMSELGDAETEGKKKRTPQWRRKQAVIEQINELIDELDEIPANIAQQAIEYIHANEVILTLGRSNTVLLFLKKAKEKRSFQVVVGEGGPSFGGIEMARSIAEAGIQATLITDAAIFAMMARVNKVVIGAQALLANGGVLAAAGAHTVALAAKRHAVPFVVLVGLHKLSPLFQWDANSNLNEFRSPSDIIGYDSMALPLTATGKDYGQTSIRVVNPSYDYVPPELVSLLITDNGGYTPAYIYRLLTEYYSREDYTLSKAILGALAR